MYRNSLSIRQYCLQPNAHQHDFNQLVFPIQGTLSIYMDGYDGVIGVGECLIIRENTMHRFTANEQARFIVADLDNLPEFLEAIKHPTLYLPDYFSAYLHYIEIQLQDPTYNAFSIQIMTLFEGLLNGLSTHPKLDKRLVKVVTSLHTAPQLRYDIDALARMACLSQTQFKTLFKLQLGQSPKSYLTQIRMNKAKTLLTNTDLPISLVAERVGYNDHSAFSRRFTETFGLPPSALR